MLKITNNFMISLQMGIKKMMTKNILIKSSNLAKSVESSFFNDIELKVIIENSVDSGVIEMIFWTLDFHLKELVRGYFGVFFDFCFTHIEKHKITIQTSLSKDEIIARISQKEFIKSCEQIIISDKKISKDSITLPFNDSKTKISQEILQKNISFFTESTHLDSAILEIMGVKDSAIFSESGFLYKAKILLKDNNAIQSLDTNPKNAIYKAIGKAFEKMQDNYLLDSAILLNFRLNMECLKILLLYKCTFIICNGKPTFSVIKNAQKFGVTIIAFDKNDFLILTHTMRFV